MNLDAKIEAVLFYRGEPTEVSLLAKIIGVPAGEIEGSLKELEGKLRDRGLTIVRSDARVMLGTDPDASPLLEKMLREELERDLGKAALETLTIVLYNGPVARSHIDYIRGVNSQFILRNLLIRGLIERIENPNDQRSFLYKPSVNLLAHLGISKIEDLPEYTKVKEELEITLRQQDQPADVK